MPSRVGRSKGADRILGRLAFPLEEDPELAECLRLAPRGRWDIPREVWDSDVPAIPIEFNFVWWSQYKRGFVMTPNEVMNLVRLSSDWVPLH